jgi:hypothetical protein
LGDRAEGVPRPDVGFHKREKRGALREFEIPILDVARIERLKIIQPNDFVAFREKAINTMGTNKSGGTGHKNFHEGFTERRFSRGGSGARQGGRELISFA